MHPLSLADETFQPAPIPRPLIQLVSGPLFVEIGIDQRMVLVQSSDLGHPPDSFVTAVPLDQPSWGFGHEEDSDTEDEAKDETEGDDDSPGARVVEFPRTD